MKLSIEIDNELERLLKINAQEIIQSAKNQGDKIKLTPKMLIMWEIQDAINSKRAQLKRWYKD